MFIIWKKIEDYIVVKKTRRLKFPWERKNFPDSEGEHHARCGCYESRHDVMWQESGASLPQADVARQLSCRGPSHSDKNVRLTSRLALRLFQIRVRFGW